MSISANLQTSVNQASATAVTSRLQGAYATATKKPVSETQQPNQTSTVTDLVGGKGRLLDIRV